MPHAFDAPAMSHGPPVEAPAREGWRLPRLAIAAAAALPCALALAMPALSPGWGDLSAFYLFAQDRWLLLAQLALLAVALIRLPAGARALSLPAWAPWVGAGAVVLLCIAGHRWILCGYDLSRDEQMAAFDARVFARGLLAQPLPEPWRAHVGALNTTFMLPATRPVAWISNYLPVNALIRAAVGSLADPTLAGPLMAGAGLPLLWGCARRLWPDDREPAAAAALLYLGSGQVLFAGMTAYAMPAHLALNLLWLWLFLAGRRGADVAALGVAWAATGLHQPLFHPLFALPFLALLIRDRAWGRVALYAAGYAAICGFWLSWPSLMRDVIDAAPARAAPAGLSYATRLAALLIEGAEARWADMAGNLLRFDAWQPVLLLPLMAAGAALARRERWTPALAASVALPVALMTLILPYQGHGFGYRYLHGALGPAILLAAAGWRALARRDGRVRPLIARSAALGWISILPLQAAMAHALVQPYALLDALIRASGADYAVVGRSDAPFAADLVLNRPDLSNRPIRLIAEDVTGELAALICRPGVRVALATDVWLMPIDRYFGVEPSGAADARLDQMSATLRSAGCSPEPFDGPHDDDPKR